MRNQRGQVTLEAILIMSMLLYASTQIFSTIREQQWVINLIEGPWTVVQGMIEDGVWLPAGETSRAENPGQINLHHTASPEQSIP